MSDKPDGPITYYKTVMGRETVADTPSVLFTSPGERDYLLRMKVRTWREMGEPDELTVTIEAGDVLNPPDEADRRHKRSGGKRGWWGFDRLPRRTSERERATHQVRSVGDPY